MQQRNGLQEVGRGDIGQYALHLAGSSAVGSKPLLCAELAVGIFGLLLTQPVVAQLVTLGRVHGGQQFEGIQRFAASVDFLEDEADGFM